MGGFVFSTNPDFDYEQNNEVESVSPSDQLLELHFEKKGRGGKQVVIIRGFEGPDEELAALGKKLKQTCGVGGSAKHGEIILRAMSETKRAHFLKKKALKPSE